MILSPKKEAEFISSKQWIRHLSACWPWGSVEAGFGGTPACSRKRAGPESGRVGMRLTLPLFPRSSIAAATWRSGSICWTCPCTTRATRLWGWWLWASHCRPAPSLRSSFTATCSCSGPASTWSWYSWIPGESGTCCSSILEDSDSGNQTLEATLFNQNVTSNKPY